jgi:hypothetical protein
MAFPFAIQRKNWTVDRGAGMALRASVCDPITNKKAQALTRLGSPLTRQELIDKV